jgi:hypothetical protein
MEHVSTSTVGGFHQGVKSAEAGGDAERLTQIRARLERELAAGQVRRCAASASGTTYAPSRWAYVPVLELIAEDNPRLIQKGPEKYVTGHEPLHRSRSGQCLVVWVDAGRWWCSSCGKRCDAVTWVMQTQDLTFPGATAQLTARYGAPPARGWTSPDVPGRTGVVLPDVPGRRGVVLPDVPARAAAEQAP